MKKSFLFCAIALICYSCEKNVAPAPDEASVSQVKSIRSYKEAESLAIKSLSMIDIASKADAVEREVESCEIIGSVDTKSGASGQDTLLYVFNFKNSAGFSVISADWDDPTPVLAFATSGSLYSADYTRVQAMEYFRYRSMIKKAKGKKFSYAYVWDDIDSYTEVSPKIKYHWGQSDFFGKFCPNGQAGCGPVAVGQIMAYYGYPDVITMSSDMDGYMSKGTNVLYNWDGMRLHKGSHDEDDTCTSYHNSIAALLREIGSRASAVYFRDGRGTATYTADIEDAFKSFGYETEVWPDKWNRPGDDLTPAVMESVLNDGPVYMVAYTGDATDRNTIGHSWVVDGCIHLKIRYFLGNDRSSTIINDVLYIHINWGWNGDCDGWFRYGEYKGGEDSYNYNPLIIAVKPRS